MQGDFNPEKKGGIDINFKRVAARAIRFWYLIVLSLAVSLIIAYLINRYSTNIYEVKASIIIKENEENAGAKFLYNNELLNPYRNFYNEIYIMKSYPLLQEVMDSLGFDVSFYREGDIKTTEYYDPALPVKFKVLPQGANPSGRSMYFNVKDENTFSLQYISKDDEKGKLFPNLRFDDTLKINGFQLLVLKRGNVKELIGQNFTVRFNDPLMLAKTYSGRLGAAFAMLGASVVNLQITGPIPRKEIDFLNKFIERYQHYDVEKKNRVATMAIKFLDEQLLVIGDTLNVYEDQVEDFKRRNVITTLEEE